MKKGFTLIELLAVIVILAIIALIATPIILGIINDARKESNERSVELYASAVRNAIASYQLTHPNAPMKFLDLNVEYDGNVVCAIEELYADGSFYITDCTVNGTVVEYTYGTKQVTQVYKPQYYFSNYVRYFNVGETEVPENSSNVPPEGEIRYLGYDVANGVVSAAYVCFTRNNTEYCLKGYDTEAFATNTEIIKDAYSDVVDTDACFFGGDISCYDGVLYAFANPNGHIGVSDDNTECFVFDDSLFGCGV